LTHTRPAGTLFLVLRRLTISLVAVFGAALGLSATVVAGNYPGGAQGIALTAAQARYAALTGSASAPSPPPDKRRGFRSGWQVGYLKGTPEKPVSAYALIYVYATVADARRAYLRSCEACTTEIRRQGIEMKLQLTAGKGTPGVLGIAACRNVYIAVGISGQVPANALAESAGTLVGRVYAKAMASGMSPCSRVN
jgi:hypothetical protein